MKQTFIRLCRII